MHSDPGHRPVDLSDAEIWALWTWHHENELASANKGEYDDAKWHKRRAGELRQLVDPAVGGKVKP